MPISPRCLPLTHDWQLVEAIGRVQTLRCARCPATKIRVRG